VLGVLEKERQGKERGMSLFRREGRRRRLSVVVAGTLFAFQAIALVGAQTVSAAPFSGGFSPTIIGGGADLNGDSVVNGRDDSNDFFGSTDIIDGKLDCNTWGTAPPDENRGTPGDLVIDGSDDCKLVAFDGTSDGVTITVTDGAFSWPSGTALPTVYNHLDPANPGVAVADFAWSTIGGKVDSNGNESIDGSDCTFGLIGQTVDSGLGVPTDGADILGSDPGCGFAGTILSANNGLVDLNSDETITSADSCTNGCFFGHNLSSGLVQAEGATAAPTITSFSPASGPVGTTVTINGTNFTGATSVTFNGVSAAFIINSNVKITATVPTGATTGKIAVTTPGGTATSATNFTVTTVPAPTITSFAPTRGPVGTSVTITGTNFRGPGFTTTSVTFNNVAATTFTVNSPTRITATVPTGATTGPIRVTTPGGTATSTTNFTVGPVLTHSRGVTLNLRKHLIARGVVSVGDGFSDCAASVPVKIQRRRAGAWRTVGTATTNDTGAYKKRIKDRPGRYRALAPKISLNDGADICSRAVSPVRRHRH
jgi:hypothetical protein